LTTGAGQWAELLDTSISPLLYQKLGSLKGVTILTQLLSKGYLISPTPLHTFPANNKETLFVWVGFFVVFFFFSFFF